MEVVRTSETWATLPTTTHYDKPRTELTSICVGCLAIRTPLRSAFDILNTEAYNVMFCAPLIICTLLKSVNTHLWASITIVFTESFASFPSLGKFYVVFMVKVEVKQIQIGGGFLSHPFPTSKY
jgi:hypothetical protein